MLVSGCDVGASVVKLVVMEDDPEQVLFHHSERIRKRNPAEVVEHCFSLNQRVRYAARVFGEPVLLQ